MPKGRSPIKRAEQIIRIEKAIELRSKGRTWQEIADELGWSSKATACKAVSQELKIRARESAAGIEAYRQQQLEQLDLLEREVWKILEKEHLALSGGKVVTVIDPDGNERRLVDDGPTLACIDRLLKIQERRAKLTGSDSPAKIDMGVTVHYTINGVDVKGALT